MKSERQLLRIAFFCASVGCCAIATPADKQSASTAGAALEACFHIVDTGTSARMTLIRKAYENGAAES